MSGNRRNIPQSAFLAGAIFFASLFFIPDVTMAAVKDTDADGLTDQAEQNVYRTDPMIADTDGDTVSDGEEVLGGTDPLDIADSRTFSVAIPEDPGIFGEREKSAWYFARATGTLSFVLLTLVMVFGMTVSSRAFVGRLNLGNVLEFHRTISWLALFSVVLHFSSFFFDDFLRLTVPEALVPFLLGRDFSTSLGFDIGKATALGIIAFYLILILILTAEFRAKATAKFWRGLHYFSFVAYPLFLAHGIMTGTDSREWWMQAIYIGSVTIVTIMILVRITFRNILPKIRARRAAQANHPPPPKI